MYIEKSYLKELEEWKRGKKNLKRSPKKKRLGEKNVESIERFLGPVPSMESKFDEMKIDENVRKEDCFIDETTSEDKEKSSIKTMSKTSSKSLVRKNLTSSSSASSKSV